MAGQGATIRHIANLLKKSGWKVAYVCVPNSPHVGVVPITTIDGTTAQRYPDILSVRDDIVRISEVEIALTPEIGYHAIERFSEQRYAILSKKSYADWRLRILELTGIDLPPCPSVFCELVVCKKISPRMSEVVALLVEHVISVVFVDNFQP